MADLTLQQLPQKVDIRFCKGDDFSLKMNQYTDASKTTKVDLTGSSGLLHICDSNDTLLDELTSAAGDIQLLDASAAFNFIITFLNARTAAYAWDSANYYYQHTDSLGIVKTLFEGKIKLSDKRC